MVQSNVDDESTFLPMLQALDSLSKELLLIFPVHPRTRQKWSKELAQCNPNLRAIAFGIPGISCASEKCESCHHRLQRDSRGNHLSGNATPHPARKHGASHHRDSRHKCPDRARLGITAEEVS